MNNILEQIKSFFSIKSNSKFQKSLIIINALLFFFVAVLSFTFDNVYPFNIINIIVFALFLLLTIIYFIKYTRKIVYSSYLVILIFLALIMVISFFANGFKEFPLTNIMMIGLAFGIYLWIYQRKENVNRYLYILLMATYVLFAVYLIKEFNNIIHINFSERIGSTLGNQNDVARKLMFAFVINFFFAFYFKNKLFKTISIIGTVISSFFIITTGSISHLLLLFVVFVVAFTAFQKSKTSKLIVLFVCIGVVSLAILMIYTIPALAPLKDRFNSIISFFSKNGKYRKDSSSMSRLNGALVGFKLFCEYPLLGSGNNAVFNSYKIMAHNNIAEIGADFGIFALIIEEIKIILPLYLISKSKDKKYKLFVILCCAYMIPLQFFLVSFNSKLEAIILPFVYLLSNDSFEGYKLNIKKLNPSNKSRIKI